MKISLSSLQSTLMQLERTVHIWGGRGRDRGRGGVAAVVPDSVNVKVAVSAVSFLQISSSSHNAAQKRVAQLLREKASEINSRVLSALAVKVEEDPFVKVKKMIKDLIVRLMEEANEEAEHKGWCDTELGTNEQTRKEATDRDKFRC